MDVLRPGFVFGKNKVYRVTLILHGRNTEKEAIWRERGRKMAKMLWKNTQIIMLCLTGLLLFSVKKQTFLDEKQWKHRFWQENDT